MGDVLYLEQFGKAFIPKRVRPELREYLLKAGVEQVPYKYFGALFWITLVLTYIVYFSWIFKPISKMGSFIVLIMTFVSWFVIQIVIVFLTIMVVYLYLNITIYKRTKLIEEALPDYLTLVSTNLKGGMAFEKSLWMAIKPEFGILAKEITLASKKVLTGNDVKEAMLEFSKKYDSPILRRSMNLIVGEVESGGRIVEIIDRVIEDLKKIYILKQQLRAATVTYIIFLGAIVVVITPALFALSAQLLKIIMSVTGQLSGAMTSMSSMPLSVSESGIKESDFRTFSVVAIGIIATFSSMIVSIIDRGDIKGGLKYIPVFFTSSIVLYFLFITLLSKVFGSIAV